MINEDPQGYLVFRALASDVRRHILDALREGSRTTGELTNMFPELSRYAVMQHLSVLVEADLVLVHREGRVRWNSLNAVPLQQIYERWLAPYRSVWAKQMLYIKSKIESRSKRECSTREKEKKP
jgi:DNA-binding transcriptional ArsR family regulator